MYKKGILGISILVIVLVSIGYAQIRVVRNNMELVDSEDKVVGSIVDFSPGFGPSIVLRVGDRYFYAFMTYDAESISGNTSLLYESPDCIGSKFMHPYRFERLNFEQFVMVDNNALYVPDLEAFPETKTVGSRLVFYGTDRSGECYESTSHYAPKVVPAVLLAEFGFTPPFSVREAPPIKEKKKKKGKKDK